MAERDGAVSQGILAGRYLALITALLIYAAWGTPTPDVMGLSEIAVALLLVLAVGPGGILAALRPALPDGAQLAWFRAGQILLLYGVSVPVLVALARGNEAGLIMRDGLAFLFMLLPLFLFTMIRQSPARMVIVTMAAVTVGLVFSWRVLFPAFLAQQGWEGILSRMHPADPSYLANAPTVLFAALLLAGLAGLRLYVAPRPRTLAMAGLLFMMAALPLVTMALILQRASMGLGALGLGFLLVLAFTQRPYRALPLLLVVVLIVAAAWPWLVTIGADLAAKNTAVGLNQRWQEAAAVMAALDAEKLSYIWGQGWGATIVSPAVGEYPVNFTHNLLTSYWLKTGIIGVGLVLLYLGALARLLWPLLWARPVLAVALAVPLAIDTMLYASFKSLDFGLILLLLAVWGGRGVSLQKGGIYSMSEGPPEIERPTEV